jgi:two-component system KDP operon response regulator KdpE
MSQPIPVAIVIEDEPNIRRLIKMALEAEQFQVFEAATVSRGLIEAGSRQPDVVLVDLGLPDGTGIDFIRDIRTWSDVPIIVVSARTHEDDKIEALNIGADDYLSKPFSPGELVARVRAQLRRRSMASDKGETVFKFGNISIDLTTRIVRREEETLHLTPIEYRLLAFLVTHPNIVLTHRQLLLGVWGPNDVENHHYVRIYMGALRKKIEDDPAQPKHVITETGVGYRFLF